MRLVIRMWSIFKEGQKETRYLLEAGVFSLVGGMVQSFAEKKPAHGRTFCGTGSTVYLSECAEPADHDRRVDRTE